MENIEKEKAEINIEKLWIAEVKQRYEYYKRDKKPGKMAEQVFRDARA